MSKVSPEGRYLDLDGQKIYFYQLGRGAPALFVHGHRSDALRLKGVMLPLAEYVEIFAPDLPGFGKSSLYPRKTYTLQVYASILADFVYKLNLKDLILAGVSMGGMIALLLYPQIKKRVKKLILVGTPVDRKFFSPMAEKWARNRELLNFLKKTKIVPWVAGRVIGSDFLMDRIMTRTLPPKARKREVIEFEKRQWRAMPATIWLQTLYDLLDFQLTKTDIKIDVPTLILEAKENQYYDVQANLVYLKSIIPNHKVIFIPWDTHVPKGDISEDFFEQFREEILTFLTGSVP